MVEVVKQPEYTLGCEKCGAELSYVYNDVHYDANKCSEYYIVCPVCKQDIGVPDPDLTSDSERGWR